MHKNLLNWITILLVLPSCTNTPPKISVVCEENNVGNSIIKWETAPLLEGEVKVYASSSPNYIPENTPIASANIADGKMVIVTNNPMQCHYYLMVFNDKYRIKTAPRNVNIAGIQNLRDLGGYKSLIAERNVRWGMLYRSAQIDNISPCSYQKLRNMKIKTIIDLRSEKECLNHSLPDDEFNIIHIPIQAGNMEDIINDIQEERIKTDTIYQMVEQINRDIVTKYHKEFKEVFNILLDADNYPVIIHCTSGKGRTGVVSALVLAALEVNEDIIMEDYRLSNDYFNIPDASRYAYRLPSNSQEAITTIYSAKEDFLNAAKKQIESEYGSVQAYLKKGIGLSTKEIEKLRSILLTHD